MNNKNLKEKEFIYALTIEDAINFLKTIKLPLKFRILITIILIVIIFFGLKEVTGASSIWDMFSFKFLENLKKSKNL